MIGILNYGCGNIKSLSNALNEIDAKYKIITHHKEITKQDKIIIPGVGAYHSAIKKIKSLNFYKEILNFSSKKPILGICLGMQILSDFGEEGQPSEGLKLINGRVEKIDKKKNISHVGWNSIILKKKGDLFKGIENKTDFYFVHAYKFNLKRDTNETTKVIFNNTYITSSIQKKNIFGLQFHPEKSHKNGLKILKNFKEI